MKSTLILQKKIKVAATSLKLEIRLFAHKVGMNTRSGTEASFTLIWCVRKSQLGYFARLISGLKLPSQDGSWMGD